MSREAFNAWANSFWDGDVGHLTPNGCMWAAWQAAQADAYERAAKVCGMTKARGPNDGVIAAAVALECANAIRNLIRGGRS